MARADSLGRVARSPYWGDADARIVVDAWRESDDSLASFCRRHKLSRSRVARWAKRLSAESVQFHPVKLVRSEVAPEPQKLEIELEDGTTVRVPAGFARVDLQHVLAVLDEREEC